MTTRKFGRTILVAALALSMVLSITGGTIAWFTDEVTSANNVITAGNLDVDVTYTTEKGEESIQNVDKLFKDVSLWEPGVLAYENLTVVNKGNLALKYEMTVNAMNENTVDDKGLSSALQVAVIEDGIAAGASREDVLSQVDTWYDFNAFEARGELLADGKKAHGVVIYWAPSANDNAWNVNNGKKTSDGLALHIDLGVKVVATQLTNEEDSFDDLYDQDAIYTPWEPNTDWYNTTATEFVIDTPQELAGLAKLVNDGTDTFKGKTIKLGKSINLANRPWTPIGRIGITSTDFDYAFKGTFDGGNYTVSNLKVSNEGWAGLFGIAYQANFKNVKLENVTLNSSRMTGSLVGQLYGSIDNCHVKNAEIKVVPNAVANGFDNGDKVGGIVGWLGDNGNNRTLKGCSATNVNLTAYRDVGGIAGYIGSSTTVEGCEADGIKIIVDQVTNHYGDKDANAGGIIGRINEPATIENKTEKNVAIYNLTGAGNEQELQNALTAGESVVLTTDVTVSSTLIVPKTKNVVINLSGHDLSYAVENDKAAAIINNSGALEITGEGTISFVAANPDLGAIPAYATNTITNTGTLTIGEGVIVTNGSEGGASYAVDNHGVFYLNGGTLIGDRCALRVAKYNQDNVVFVMNGGRVKAKTPAWIQLPGSNASDAPKISVTINGGTMQSTKAASADNDVMYTYSFGNSHANTSVTINGGSFLGGTVSIGSGYKGDAPKLTINGGTFEYDVLQWLANDGSTVLYKANK